MNQKSSKIQDTNESMELLQPVSYFFVILYICLSIAHFFLLQESYKWILFTSALLTAILALAIGLNTSKISSAQQSLFILLLVLVASSNSLLHLWLSVAPEQTTNIFVCIIASGIVLSNRVHWITSVLYTWLGWSFINFLIELPLTQHFFFAMAMSTLLSWFAHLARKKLVEKQIELEQERDIAIAHKQDAMAATEAKSAFLANMSHEIRTPMNGVIGMIELVSHSQLDEKQKDYLATAKRSAESLLVIINDILDFSKIEAGELTIELVEFDLETFFNEFIHDQQFQTNRKKLKLELVKSHFQDTKVVGDPYRIKQILNNIMSNAIKFTDAGAIVVKYNVISQNLHRLLKVEISDTGIGVSNEVLPHLFDSFSQADTSTTRKFGGTGLGLAITKQLCELMGGEITVKSELGKGTVFELSIKLLPSTPALVLSENEALCSTSMPANFSKMRILLVEDNLINQEVMLAILNGLDLKVSVANDGQEAIEMLACSHANTVDLILMDCQMPTLDGYEATSRIRAGEAGEAFKHVPITALTANTMKSEREKCFDAGMDEYLSKPVDTEALKQILAKYQPT